MTTDGEVIGHKEAQKARNLTTDGALAEMAEQYTEYTEISFSIFPSSLCALSVLRGYTSACFVLSVIFVVSKSSFFSHPCPSVSSVVNSENPAFATTTSQQSR